MHNLERAFVSLQNKHIKLQKQLAAQQQLLQSRKATTKIIHIHESPRNAPHTKQAAPAKKSAAPPLPMAPPPPPSMLPPPVIAPPKKLTFTRRAPVAAAATEPGAISLQHVLGARSGLRKANERKALAPKGLPKPAAGGFGVSLSDISGIQLRRVAGSTKPKPESPAKPLLSNSLFRLRSTALQRSPGGTPMKENIAINADSPANMLSSALRKKFRQARPSPNNKSPSRRNRNSLPPSPYESPKVKAPVLAVR